MNTQTDLYINGAKAINNFFNMLHHAMLESMPGVEISGSGAWVWRGFRIDSYKELAKGLFYCQIYTDQPNVLLFQESYYFPKYKPIDIRDIEHKVKTGRYYQPFSVRLDLYKSRFFLFTVSEQYELLQNFVSYAALQARIWQKSELRARPEITSKEYLLGNEKISHNPLPHPKDFHQVSIDYLNLLPLQKVLFGKLKDIVDSTFREKYEWFRPNAAWQNWSFRGYRLNISGGDSADFIWEIYYEKPEKLNCYSKGARTRKLEGYLDICSTKYFDQNDEQQEKLLRDFVQNTLGSFV